jgi:hypothetical protein
LREKEDGPADGDAETVGALNADLELSFRLFRLWMDKSSKDGDNDGVVGALLAKHSRKELLVSSSTNGRGTVVVVLTSTVITLGSPLSLSVTSTVIGVSTTVYTQVVHPQR